MVDCYSLYGRYAEKQRRSLNEVLNGKRQVNTELALLVEAALDIPAESLLQMQARYNILAAKRNKSFMEKLQNVSKIVAAL